MSAGRGHTGREQTGREHTADGAPSFASGQREATVLFADLLGFRELTRSVRVDEAYALVTGCLGLLDEIARRHGAAVDKYLGDALMAVFGHPIPLEDASRAALLAAVEMHHCVAAYNREQRVSPPLGLRIGVDSGSVFFGTRSGSVVREFHPVGDSVNLAARLKARAAPGQVLVGEATYEAAKAGFEFTWHAPFRFKGKSEAVRFFELDTSKRPVGGIGGPAEISRRAPLVGRDAERAALEEALRALEAGRGGVILLRGRPGSGKTRLVEELLAHPGTRAFGCQRAAATRAGEAVRYDALAELFRGWAGIARRDAAQVALPRLRTALAGALGEAAPEALDPFCALLGIAGGRRVRAASRPDRGSVEAAVARVLEAMAERTPQLLVLEDLHWADADSLDVLAALLPACLERPLLFVLTLEPDRTESARRLLEIARARAADRLCELALAPLSPEESRELVARVLPEGERDDELVGVVAARGRGNPAALIRAAFLAPAIRQQRAALDRERASDSERRRATVVFADLTGFTSMTERLPAETMHGLVDECMTILDEVTRKYAGSVEKHLGDCALAFFGVPTAVEDAPRAALNAAIEMRDRIRDFGRSGGAPSTLDVHIGVETGLGVAGEVQGSPLREFVVLGEAVSFASQLCDSAPGGSVFVGRRCHDATRGVFAFEERTPLAPGAGLAPEAVFELLSTRPRLHRPTQSGALFSELVGRDRELAAMRERVSRLGSGTGGVVSVRGEAGIGKSRLVRELLESPDAGGALALPARSLSVGANLSFHPFADLLRTWLRISDDLDDEAARGRLEQELRRLLPAEADEMAPFVASLMGIRLREEQRRRMRSVPGDAMERLILRSVTILLRRLAGERPLLLVFEDLHWADVSSVELLETLLHLVEREPILVVALFRPGFPSTSGRILEAVRERHAGRHLELALEPLPPDAIGRLVDNLFRRAAIPARVRGVILEKTSGNPFYVEEVARSLLDQGAVELREGELHAVADFEAVEIPGTIHEVVMARLDRRPLRQRRLIQLAAVVGYSFHVDVLAEILGDKQAIEQDLRDLEDAGFVVPLDRFAGRELGFKHPLIQEVAYDTIVASRREALHGEVARAVEARLTENVPGYHGMLAYHYVRAREGERAEELLFRAGDEAARVAASSEALHYFQQALDLFFELHGDRGDPRKRAVLEKKIATALHHRGRFLEAVEHYNRALRLLGVRVPARQSEVVARFVRNLCAVLLDLYAPVRLRRRRDASSEEREIVELMFDRAQAQTTTSPTRFLFDGMENLARLQRVDPASVPEAGRMYAGTVGIFSYGGVSFETSRRFLSLAEGLVGDADPGQLMMFHCMSFCHHLLQGDWSERHEAPPSLVAEALGIGRLWEVTTYLGLLTEKNVYQGRFERARESLEQVGKIQELYQYDLAKTNHDYSSALLPMQQMRLPEALAAVKAYFDENPEDLLHILAMGAKSKVQIQLGDRAGAEESLALGARLVERSRPVPPFHLSSYLRSRLLLDLVVWEDALAGGDQVTARRARAAARRSARPALRAARKVAWRRTEVFRLLGRLQWLEGRHGSALQWWRRSLEAGRALEALPELARTQAELGRRLDEGEGPRALDGTDARGFRAEADRLFARLGIQEQAEREPDPR